MIEKKLNWKIYFFMILFGGTLILAAYAFFLSASGRLGDENGNPLGVFWRAVLCLTILIVCSSYAVTFFSLLYQTVARRRTAFIADSEGIRSTVVLIHFAAFVLAVPVRFIPWSAVSYISVGSGDNSVFIRAKKNGIEASRLARLILRTTGYHFCLGFLKIPLSQDEQTTILNYCRTRSPYIEI